MNEPDPQAARMHVDPPRYGLDAAATIFRYPPGVRRVADELTRRLAASTRVVGIPLVPAVDDSERTWRHRELPRLAKRLGLAGIVSFTSAFPLLGPGRRVQVIHELPWRHGVKENAGRGHRLWARQGWRRASAIVVPSERVLADLADETPRAARIARVIPWGLSAEFGPGALLGSSEEGERLGLDEGERRELGDRELRERLGLDGGGRIDPEESERLRQLKHDQNERLQRLGIGEREFLLAAGATRPKKRLDACLVALAQLGARAPMLIVTGEITEALAGDLRLARTLGLEGKLVFLGRVKEADMALLTRRARAALSLADSEGFGFGTLEALGSGVPVLVTRGSAQAELAGEHGIVVDPEDPDGVASALRGVLGPRNDVEAARRIEHARGYPWAETVRRLEDLLVSLS